jgi:chromosome segregation ATPase
MAKIEEEVLNEIRTGLKEIRTKISALEKRQAKVEERLKRLIKEVEDLQSLGAKFNSVVYEVEEKIDTLNREFLDELKAELGELEAQVDELATVREVAEETRDIVRSYFERIKFQIMDLEDFIRKEVR